MTSMKQGMRHRRRAILQYWIAYTDAHRCAPTIREAAAALNISSTSVVKYHLDQLVRAGYLKHESGKAHAYRVPVHPSRSHHES